MNGLASFEKDNRERFGLKVSWTKLDKDIAKTIQAPNAKYHKVYRTYCSNSRLKESLTKMNLLTQNSPKRISSFLQYLLYISIFVACDGQNIINLLEIETGNIDTKLRA